jgi:hypothetical protein
VQISSGVCHVVISVKGIRDGDKLYTYVIRSSGVIARGDRSKIKAGIYLTLKVSDQAILILPKPAIGSQSLRLFILRIYT